MPSLERQTIVSFAQFIVFAALLLFLPAWTLAYWQAWLFLAVFMLSSILTTIYVWRKDPALLERRLRGGPTAEKEPIQRVIQTFASITILALFVFPAIDHRFHWSDVPVSAVLVAEVVIAFGFYLIYLVFKENSYSAATVEIAPGQSVVSTGPYAIVRHPMYSSALLLIFAMPIALGSWWGLLLFPPFAAVIVWRLWEEEKFLVNRLPGYAAYQKKVPYRLLPLIW